MKVNNSAQSQVTDVETLVPNDVVDRQPELHRRKVSKFCILTTQRSGSTWLMDLLNNHPKIKIYNELFLNMNHNSKWADPKQMSFLEYQKVTPGKRPWKTIKYLKNLYLYQGQYEAIGFKLMYDQLFRKPEILVNLLLEGYRIIHLVRENCLDVVVSYAIARSNKLFYTEREVETGKIYLEPKALLQELKKQDFKVKLAHLLLAILPNSSIYITYDDLCQNKDKTFQSILEFLSILDTEQNNEVESSLKKINSKKHSEIIANYEEVKETLKMTKFHRFLESN